MRSDWRWSTASPGRKYWSQFASRQSSAMYSQEDEMSLGVDAAITKPTAPASPRIDDDCVTSLHVALQRYLD